MQTLGLQDVSAIGAGVEVGGIVADIRKVFDEKLGVKSDVAFDAANGEIRVKLDEATLDWGAYDRLKEQMCSPDSGEPVIRIATEVTFPEFTVVIGGVDIGALQQLAGSAVSAADALPTYSIRPVEATDLEIVNRLDLGNIPPVILGGKDAKPEWKFKEVDGDPCVYLEMNIPKEILSWVEPDKDNFNGKFASSLNASMGAAEGASAPLNFEAAVVKQDGVGLKRLELRVFALADNPAAIEAALPKANKVFSIFGDSVKGYLDGLDNGSEKEAADLRKQNKVQAEIGGALSRAANRVDPTDISRFGDEAPGGGEQEPEPSVSEVLTDAGKWTRGIILNKVRREIRGKTQAEMKDIVADALAEPKLNLAETKLPNFLAFECIGEMFRRELEAAKQTGAEVNPILFLQEYIKEGPNPTLSSRWMKELDVLGNRADRKAKEAKVEREQEIRTAEADGVPAKDIPKPFDIYEFMEKKLGIDPLVTSQMKATERAVSRGAVREV